MRGDFSWLDTPQAYDQSIAREKAGENTRSLELLKESSARLGVQLPEAFTKFMETPALQARIWSNTDCFLDLCPELVASPIGDGYLIRFLADSQGCVFWYVYLTLDFDHAVVSSPDFYCTEAEQWQDEPPNPNEIVYCAESFETFICRFWLENQIWLAGYERTALSPGGCGYVQRYQNKRT